jgi:hypothetical protein
MRGRLLRVIYLLIAQPRADGVIEAVIQGR